MIITIGLLIIAVSYWTWRNTRKEVETMRVEHLIDGLTFRGEDFSLCEGYGGSLSCVTDETTGAIYCYNDEGDWSMQQPEKYAFGDLNSIRIDDVFREWERR